ncbi:hypothetical protein KBI23_04935 [bacterium]|nr:hypothetical protein [bacterium]MBP9807240.1 hypothetical protein [bacterium]
MFLLNKILLVPLLTFMLLAGLPAQALPFHHAKAKIVGFTRVVRAGQICSVTVQTEPGAYCQITVQKPNGKASRHPNLIEKRADTAGTVNWSWQMVEDAQAGERVVTVKCITADNDETTIQKKMKVL